MKTMFFNASVISSGQKSSVVNATPQLIANSTGGKFTVTSPVSKALGIAVGENIMFLDDFAEVEKAIQNNDERVVEFAQENGIDLTTRDGINAVIAGMGHFYIAKGIFKRDKTGAQMMTQVRMTQEDKKKYILQNKEALVEANRDALIERNNGQDADVDTLVALIGIDEVTYPQVPLAEGSKTSTTSNSTGVGCTLGFTDNAIWQRMKNDMADEDKKKKNRIYDVLLDNPIEGEFNDGFENIKITYYPLIYKEDKDIIVRGASED